MKRIIWIFENDKS